MVKRLIKNRFIQVVLLESNKHLGEKYEVVNVKPIFAKNILIPKNIAVLATPDALHKYNDKITKAKEQIRIKKDGMDKFFLELQQKGGVTIFRKTNEKGSLYDKVGSNDIVNLIKEEYNVDLQDNHVKMKKSISVLGEHKVVYRYKDLEKMIIVTVKEEENEKKAEK